MSDKCDNLSYEHDYHGDELLNGFDDQEMPMEVADQTEEPTEDTLGFLICGEREIFSQDSLKDSQLVKSLRQGSRDCKSSGATKYRILGPKCFRGI